MAKKIIKRTTKKTVTKTTAKRSPTATKKAVAKRSTTAITKKAAASVPVPAKKTGMPKVGDIAPDFQLLDMHGHAVTLSKLRGTQVVIYFYPKDDTSGCTIEAQGFSKEYNAFLKRGVVVFGISKDTTESHCAFAKKYSLTVPLLSDPTGTTIQKYGCWVEKSMYGKKYMGIQRATFVIGKDGRIRKVFPDVTPEGHAKEVLAGL